MYILLLDIWHNNETRIRASICRQISLRNLCCTVDVYVQAKLNRKQNSFETLRKSDVVPTLNIQQIEQSSLKLPSQRPNEDQTSTKLTSLAKKRTNSWKEKQIYKKKRKKNRVGSRQQAAVTGTRNYCEPSQWHAAQHARYHAAGADDDVLRQWGRIFIGETSEFGFCQFADHGWLRGTGQWFRDQLISTIERYAWPSTYQTHTYIYAHVLYTSIYVSIHTRKYARAQRESVNANNRRLE